MFCNSVKILNIGYLLYMFPEMLQMDLQTLAKDYTGPAFDPYDFVKGEQVWNYIRRVNDWRYAIHDMEEPQMANPGGLCQERRGIE